MAKQEFENCLRDYLQRQPFQPFVIELREGRRVIIRQPPVVFCDGDASIIDPSDGALVESPHDQVQAFGPWEQGGSRVTDEELEAALRSYNRRRPFRGFLLEFVSGLQVQIEHREAIAFFAPLWLYRGPKKAQAVFPSSSVCRMLDGPVEK